MIQKVKILSKYSIDAIDYEVEKKRAESTMKDRIESLGTTLEELKRINSKKKKTEDDLKLLDAVIAIEKEYSETISQIEEYKELITSAVPEYTELDQAVPYYEEDSEGKIKMLWEIRKNDPTRVIQKIKSLKKELSDSDYKITKCYEASLLNQTIPYDIETLYSERQAKRDAINRLETILKSTEPIDIQAKVTK